MKNKFYLITFAIIVSVISVFMLSMLIELEDEVENKIFEISTADQFFIVKNSAHSVKVLLKDSTNYIDDIKISTALQNIINNKLKILITKNIKYAYLLYRDEKGIFRFLADGSKKEDKAFLNQKFDVDNPVWFDVYTKKIPLVIEHKLLHNLSISYLVPILYKNEVKLVLAVDFSINRVEKSDKLMDLMKKGIFAILGTILLFFIIFVVQAIRYRAVEKTAFYDKLTNILNRNYLLKSQDFFNLNDYILAIIDIDHFKKINDTYGHVVGDEILKQFANVILSTTRRKDDIVIRYGGEEFLVLAKTNREDNISALNLIQRIFLNIQKNKFYISEKEFVNITTSIGVNLAPYHSKSFSDAFKLADSALYVAKSSGRNKIEIYDKNNKEDLDISINELKSAIENDRIICHFQKIINMDTQKELHYESLFRIVDTKGNIFKEDKIIPIIKGTFILRDMSKKVLAICYKKLITNENIFINVNLCQEDIINKSIFKILKDYASKENISNRLGLEIRSSQEIVNHKKIIDKLLSLKEMGYKIFIDNFGNGYSDFVYPIKIKPDYIKIDGRIIEKITEDKDLFLVVKNIVNFAKGTNIKVIATNVKNKDIYEKIKTLDIKYAQGYFISEPKVEIKT